MSSANKALQRTAGKDGGPEKTGPAAGALTRVLRKAHPLARHMHREEITCKTLFLNWRPNHEVHL